MIELQQLQQEFCQRKEEFAQLKEKVKQICQNFLIMSEEHQSQLAQIFMALLASGAIIIPEGEIGFEEVMEEVNRINEVKKYVINWEQAREIIRNTSQSSRSNLRFVLKKRGDSPRIIARGDGPTIEEVE